MISGEYVLTKDWPREEARLRLLDEMVDDFSRDALRAAGLTSSSRCLDIGAGTGSVAAWCASQADDPAQVTATDLDIRYLTELRQTGVQVRQHDVVTDDFPPGSFDIIHARAVFEHLPTRDDLLDRVATWLAPGGALVLVNCASFPVINSPHPAYGAAMRAWVDVLARTGTDYEWARRCPTAMVTHGYRDVQAVALLPMMVGGSIPAQFWSWTLEGLRTRITDGGHATNETLDEARRLLADPTFYDVAPAMIAAYGRRR